ncbi:unnamed protein product [Effrenium voratum]|uniref:Uncharacterized protein n=1 Tax=Effrenium voratum TaxID=2562239 RepID=A0AA36J198_9DINO|nr:unnamed protein product [Effrenium voratum]
MSFNAVAGYLGDLARGKRRVTASRPSLTGKTCRPRAALTPSAWRRWNASCRRSPWRMWVSQSDGWTLRSLARLGPTDLQAASEKEEEHPNPCVGVAKEASQSCVCSGNLARGYSSTLTQQQLAMVARWSSASD